MSFDDVIVTLRTLSAPSGAILRSGDETDDIGAPCEGDVQRRNLHGRGTMILAWLDGQKAAEIGAALADEFAPRPEATGTRGSTTGDASDSMERLLRRADSDVRPLHLNFYKR